MKQVSNFSSAHQELHKNALPFAIHAIQRIEDNRIHGDSAVRNDDHFMIVWVTKGDGYYFTGNQKNAIINNHLLFIRPGQFHNILLSDNTEGYIISFTASFLDFEDKDTESVYGILYQIFAHSEVIADCSEVLEDMQDIAQIMLKEFNKHSLYRAEVLRRYFKIFLIYLSRLVEGQVELTRQTQPRNAEILRNFMNLLEKNFRSQKMVADYANILAVTPNYLNEVIKRLTGHSAGHHIRQRVALEAKTQAVHSNSCMKNIAYDLGFFDMAHFSKFFKNATGMNFSDFKKSNTFAYAN
jgi:AraC family transcriptional activator of pobA